MTISRREALAASVAALPMFYVSARGQTPPPAGAAGGRQPAGRDPLLAACLLIGGKRQIEVCQFAKEKLQNEDCKQFAQAEIDEHEGVKAKLKEFGLELPAPAGSAGGVVQAGGAGAAGANGLPPVPQMAVGRVMLPGGASELVAIERQVGEKCVENYKEMMSKKSGVKFDKAFVGDQLITHQGLLDRVQVFKMHASPGMQPVLAEAQQTIEQHIAQCEQLMQKLEERKEGERKEN